MLYYTARYSSFVGGADSGCWFCQMPVAAVEGRKAPDSLDRHKINLSRGVVSIGHVNVSKSEICVDPTCCIQLFW